MTSETVASPLPVTFSTVADGEPQSREARARALIQRNALMAGGIGFVPLPFFDQVSVGALLGKLVYDLGQLYGVATPKYRTKATIAAVLGGAHVQWITFYALGFANLLVPGAGFLGTLAFRPLIAGAITFTVGNIFLRQFARGNTLENFDVAAAKREFERGYEEGKAFMRQQLAQAGKAA
jgi:uncharacterized protein (DUF697 family)